MNRFLVQLIVAAVLLSSVSACKCSRDDDSSNDVTADTAGAPEGELSETEADERAAAEALAALRARQCGELVDRAWTRVTTTFRLLGMNEYRGFESEYRDAAKNMQEQCLQMSDEQMGCVRSAQDVLFGLLSCEVVLTEEQAVAEIDGADESCDGEGDDCDEDEDAAAGRRLSAPSIARWVRPALRENYSAVPAFAQDGEIPSGEWTEGDGDYVVSISEEGTFRPEDSDDDDDSVTIRVTSPGVMTMNFEDGAERSGFHRDGDKLWMIEGPGIVATPFVSGTTSVVDLDGDFVIYEENERSACQAVHASGATLESECRVIDTGSSKQTVFRYRFPGTGVDDANEFTFDWVGDVLINSDAERWERP